MKKGPIAPDEIGKYKSTYFPEEVYKAFNELIVKNFSGDQATVYQDDVVEYIMKLMPHLSREQVFEKKYLDVEQVYRNEGWNVSYSKPGYNETGKSYFIFQKK